MWREEVELVPTTRFQSDLVQQRVDAYNVGKEDRKLLREAERELNPDPLFEGTFIQCIHCRISVVEMGKIQTFTLNNKKETFSQFSSVPLQTELQSIDSFVLHTSRACSHHCNCDCMEQQGSHPHLNVIYLTLDTFVTTNNIPFRHKAEESQTPFFILPSKRMQSSEDPQ